MYQYVKEQGSILKARKNVYKHVRELAKECEKCEKHPGYTMTYLFYTTIQKNGDHVLDIVNVYRIFVDNTITICIIHYPNFTWSYDNITFMQNNFTNETTYSQ